MTTQAGVDRAYESPKPSNKLPLPTLATAINAKLAECDATGLLLTDQRIAAGVMLAEAKERVDKGTFETWCKANIKRSKSDIRALMALAKAPDPVQARETEKARAREGMASTRAAAAVTLQRSTPKPNAATWAAQAPTGQHSKDITFERECMRIKSLAGNSLVDEMRQTLAMLDSVQWQTMLKSERDRCAVAFETIVKRIRNEE